MTPLPTLRQVVIQVMRLTVTMVTSLGQETQKSQILRQAAMRMPLLRQTGLSLRQVLVRPVWCRWHVLAGVLPMIQRHVQKS